MFPGLWNLLSQNWSCTNLCLSSERSLKRDKYLKYYCRKDIFPQAHETNVIKTWLASVAGLFCIGKTAKQLNELQQNANWHEVESSCIIAHMRIQSTNCVLCIIMRIQSKHKYNSSHFTCDSSQSTSLEAGTTDLKVFRWWSLSLEK